MCLILDGWGVLWFTSLCADRGGWRDWRDMSKWFVVVEAWDGDSDYLVYESSDDAASRFAEFRDDVKWAGVWRDLRVMSLPVTDAEIVAYEEANDGDYWSFWDHNDKATLIHSWVAPKCEQQEFRCNGPRESSVTVDGLVWHLCEACAEAVS